MPQIKFTSALKRFYPNLDSQSIEGQTIAEVLENLDKGYPGIKDYITDELGALRKHVNIYIGDYLIEDREELQDEVGEKDEILIFQALSGG